jgi:ABC-type sugar transport system substrate-binding protein
MVFALVIAAGCGSDKSGSSSSTAAGSNNSTAAADAPKKAVTIAIAMTQNSGPYYGTAQLGGEAAGPKEGNAKVVVQGPADPLGGAVVKVAQNLATSLNPDGFGVNPCLLAQWTRVINSLSRSVPNDNLIAWNCKPGANAAAAEKSPVKTFIGANDFETGYQSAKVAIENAKLGPDTTGTALLALCFPGIPILEQRRDGMLKAVKELLPKAKPVEFVSDAYPSKALVKWTSTLTKYPDVVYASGSCDQDITALSTLRARGTGGDFAVGTINPTARQVAQIQSGQLSAGVADTPWVIGNVTARLLIRSARGEARPEGWVNTGLKIITKDTATDWLNAAKSPAQAKAFFEPMADKLLDDVAANTHPMADAYAEG